MMERSSALLSYENLPEGQATVGFEVCIKHVAAAAEGSTCRVRTTLREVDRRSQAPLRRRGDRGRADDRGRDPRAAGDRRRPAWLRRAPPTLPFMASFRAASESARSGRVTDSRTSPRSIATADKVRLIDMLADSGLRRLEVTSFVRPDVIPQLADAEEVLSGVRAPRRRLLLGPDPERAGAGARARACATASTRSTSSSPPRRPTTGRTSTARSTSRWRAWSGRSPRAGEAGLRCEGVISVSFGCPYEGEVPPERVFEIAESAGGRRLRGDRLRRHDRDGQPAPGARVLRRRAASAWPGSS